MLRTLWYANFEMEFPVENYKLQYLLKYDGNKISLIATKASADLHHPNSTTSCISTFIMLFTIQ